jgi:hypothetical protein
MDRYNERVNFRNYKRNHDFFFWNKIIYLFWARDVVGEWPSLNSCLAHRLRHGLIFLFGSLSDTVTAMSGNFKLSLHTSRNAVSELCFRSNHLTWANGAVRTLNAALESCLTEVRSPIRHSVASDLTPFGYSVVPRLILPLQKIAKKWTSMLQCQ